MHSLCTFKIHI